MSEAGFPNAYNTEPVNPPTYTGITCLCFTLDIGIVRSIYGIVKIVEIALDLLGFISVMCVTGAPFAFYYSRAAWFNTVAIGGFWYSAIVLFLYTAHMPEKFTIIPWKKAEFIICALWTFFYVIAASLAASSGNSDIVGAEAFSAAAFFGFCAMVAYGYDAWQCYVALGGAPLIRRTVTTTTTTTTTERPNTTY